MLAMARDLCLNPTIFFGGITVGVHGFPSSYRECYRFLFSWGFRADFLTAVIQQWLVKIMLTYLKKKI